MFIEETAAPEVGHEPVDDRKVGEAPKAPATERDPVREAQHVDG